MRGFDMTIEEARAHQSRVRAGRKGVSAVKPAQVRPKREGRVKGAKQTEVDGIKFPSKGEARRYQELKIAQRAGDIRRLRRQVRFPLVVKGWPVYEEGYRADFTYYELEGGEWAYIVEDKKGHKTEIYLNKKRLMKAIYGIEIRES
jgi:hypothetical protein